MFNLFKRRPQQSVSQLPKQPGIIGKYILKLQTIFATSLSKQEQKLTLKQRKIALLVFCLIVGTMSGSFIFRAVFSKDINHDPSYIPNQQTEQIPLPRSPREIMASKSRDTTIQKPDK